MVGCSSQTSVVLRMTKIYVVGWMAPDRSCWGFVPSSSGAFMDCFALKMKAQLTPRHSIIYQNTWTPATSLWKPQIFLLLSLLSCYVTYKIKEYRAINTTVLSVVFISATCFNHNGPSSCYNTYKKTHDGVICNCIIVTGVSGITIFEMHVAVSSMLVEILIN